MFTLTTLLVACSAVPPHFDGSMKESLAVEGGRLLVAAKLDGVRSILVVDTAASITSLSTQTAERVGVEAISNTEINQELSAQLGVLRSLSIGVSEHADLTVAIVDLPNAVDSEVKFDGVLGLDVLSRHDLLLDMPRRTFTFDPPGTFERTPARQSMQRVDISTGQYGLIMMEVTFGDHPPIPAILDLGAPSSVVNNAAAQMLGVPRPAFRPQDLRVGTVGLDVGYILVRDLPLFDRLGMANHPVMLIGSDVFENRSLAIAFRDRAAYVSRR